MRELGILREGWDALEADEIRLLRRLTVHESIRQWLILQRTFEPQLQETATIFGSERQTALAQLQARLCRLAEWQKSMENLLQSIRTLQDRPSDAGTPSIVIGGVAVAAWGEPRITRDVDLSAVGVRRRRPSAGRARA